MVVADADGICLLKTPSKGHKYINTRYFPSPKNRFVTHCSYMLPQLAPLYAAVVVLVMAAMSYSFVAELKSSSTLLRDTRLTMQTLALELEDTSGATAALGTKLLNLEATLKQEQAACLQQVDKMLLAASSLQYAQLPTSTPADLASQLSSDRSQLQQSLDEFALALKAMKIDHDGNKKVLAESHRHRGKAQGMVDWARGIAANVRQAAKVLTLPTRKAIK